MTLAHIIRQTVAEVAVVNVHDDLARIKDPSVWRRLQKSKTAHGIAIRDYHAQGTDVTARVRVQDGKVMDVALMTLETMRNLHLKEQHLPGRPWSPAPADVADDGPVTGAELLFGMAEVQKGGVPCVLITPASYFASTGSVWPGDLSLSHILPGWLVASGKGIYKTDGRHYESVKEILLDCGLVESDAVTAAHFETMELELLVSPDDSYM